MVGLLGFMRPEGERRIKQQHGHKKLNMYMLDLDYSNAPDRASDLDLVITVSMCSSLKIKFALVFLNRMTWKVFLTCNLGFVCEIYFNRSICCVKQNKVHETIENNILNRHSYSTRIRLKTQKRSKTQTHNLYLKQNKK